MRLSAGLAAVVLVLLGAAQPSQAQTSFQLDPEHSFVVFRASHANAGMVYGRFNDPAGTIALDAQGTPTSVDLQIQARNVDTDNERRDNHLRGPDFFNAEQFPTITFKSSSIRKTGDDTFEVSGDLALHGQTRPLTVTLKKTGESRSQMGHRVGFETQTKLDRTAYGITFMPEMIGTEIQLTIAVEVMPAR